MGGTPGGDVNTGHLVGPCGCPKSHILHCLYLIKTQVTCVGAPDWLCIACDRFLQYVVGSAVNYPYHVPRMVLSVSSAYFSVLHW